MSNREIIATVLVRTLNASRLTQVRNIATAHENCWREFMNGSISSQNAADHKLAEVVTAAVAELDDKAIEYIVNSFK